MMGVIYILPVIQPFFYSYPTQKIVNLTHHESPHSAQSYLTTFTNIIAIQIIIFFFTLTLLTQKSLTILNISAFQYFLEMQCKYNKYINGLFLIGKIIIQCYTKRNIMLIREKVKSEIKNTVDRFNRTPAPHSRPVPIHKKSMKKKRVHQRENFYQKRVRESGEQIHVLNFYNMLAINQRAIRDQHHDESFIKSYFYHKNLKRIEATEHYLIIHLSDHRPKTASVSEVIKRYKTDSDSRFHVLAGYLEDIERRVSFNRPETAQTASMNADAIAYLDSLGHAAYICKISSNRLVVSLAMMDMFGYNSEDFIIECLKFRMPLFEGFSCQGYFQLIVKNLQNVALLLDYLDGRIPLATFNELHRHDYEQLIRSKNNVQYRCAMSISMPVPLTSLIKVEKVLQTSESLQYENAMVHSREFKAYTSLIRQREYNTLQHLVWLPDNTLPVNRLKVADYVEKSFSDEEISKSIQTE